MGSPSAMRVFRASSERRELPPLSPNAGGRKPRDYVEWKTLRGWGQLPDWEESPPGYLLREAREGAGLTQAELGARLGCSQQAVARAERWDSNPTVGHMRRWGEACGASFEMHLSPHDGPALAPRKTRRKSRPRRG